MTGNIEGGERSENAAQRNTERVKVMSAMIKTGIASGADLLERPSYDAYLRRFEAEATAFERGFKTALFIEQFRAGLLPNAGRKSQRLQ